MKIKFLLILTAILFLTFLPYSVLAITCNCSGTVNLDQSQCQSLGFDFENGQCQFSLENVDVQNKNECTQEKALTQSALSGMDAVIACEYSADKGEPCNIDADCTTGNCENNVCADAPESTGGDGNATKDAAATQDSTKKDLSTAISKVEGFLGKKPIKGEMISGDVPTIVGKALRVFLGIVGSLALAIFVYGGIMWMISGGNPERIKKAQGTIVWSVLGLMVIFLSYVIVSMIISGITHESKIIEQQAEQRDACLEQCIEERDEALAQCQDLASKTDTGEIDEDEYELCVKSARSRAENCRDICRERFQ